MRANEFIQEGIIGDLRAAGRQNQASMAASAKQKVGSFVDNMINKIPGYTKLKNYAANVRNEADIRAAADSWIKLWAHQVAQMQSTLPQGTIVDLDTYKQGLENWLQKSLGVDVDPAKVDQYVRDTNPKSLQSYFADYFIPEYVKVQKQATQARFTGQSTGQSTGAKVPAGQRIAVVHPMTQGKYYKTAQGWTNEAGQKVTKQSSIDYLEDLVAKDPVKYEPA